MSKNLYTITTCTGDRLNVSADFYRTNKNTGVNTFYIGGPWWNKLIATFTGCQYIALASAVSKLN